MQGMGAGEAVDALSGQEPRKSWQMRKRQERAALKEGLAEWQASVLPAETSQQATLHWQPIRHHSCAAFEWPAGTWTRASKKSLLRTLIAETLPVQANPYYVAGRCTVPAIIDTLSASFFNR